MSSLIRSFLARLVEGDSGGGRLANTRADADGLVGGEATDLLDVFYVLVGDNHRLRQRNLEDFVTAMGAW